MYWYKTCFYGFIHNTGCDHCGKFFKRILLTMPWSLLIFQLPKLINMPVRCKYINHFWKKNKAIHNEIRHFLALLREECVIVYPTFWTRWWVFVHPLINTTDVPPDAMLYRYCGDGMLIQWTVLWYFPSIINSKAVVDAYQECISKIGIQQHNRYMCFEICVIPMHTRLAFIAG